MKRLLLLSLFLAACHGHGYKAPAYEPVHRVDYSYQRQNDGEVVVFAKNGNALARAMLELGCGKDFICLTQQEGDIYTVLQRKK